MIFTLPVLALLLAAHRADAFSLSSRPVSVHRSIPPLTTNADINPSKNLYRRCTALQMASATENNYFKGLDSYQILEIPRSADLKEIKAAYRKLVSKWHPDKFPDDEAKKIEGGLRMEKINRAYFTIGDEDRKRRYDQFGEAGVGTSAASEEQIKAAGGPGMGGFGGQGGAVDVGDISDIFDAFFGGQQGGRMGGNRQPRNANATVAGDDLQVEVEIPFMTAIFGGQEKVKVRRLEECGTCGGSGIKPGAKSKTCSGCTGKGVVNNMQRTPFGVFNNVQTCPTCRGSGQEIEEYCPTCRGKGSTAETKEVTIRVPAGTYFFYSLSITTTYTNRCAWM
jgi:molecular chaperone DnaJ